MKSDANVFSNILVRRSWHHTHIMTKWDLCQECEMSLTSQSQSMYNIYNHKIKLITKVRWSQQMHKKYLKETATHFYHKNIQQNRNRMELPKPN